MVEQFLNEKNNLRDDYDELSIGLSNEIILPSYIVVDTTNCESLGNPKETIEQEEPRQCKDLAKEGFRFVQRKCSKIFNIFCLSGRE